ncbi:hypothetical protein [Jiella flava]|uniref:Uncharacterized protein n=1 Tax=Jiella flava TaxID=2816857 RepID=A0A939FUP4_9HYPH|nr:hypothetical protein [Jiella flava]MBO0661164.1 hypothetical protein [Jiella flava]
MTVAITGSLPTAPFEAAAVTIAADLDTRCGRHPATPRDARRILGVPAA